tara:strand:- start:182 stop:697 length:516 start_codon:yes stop_codon:yes gene_type:complete
MADFRPAFDKTMLAEGGYKLHTIVGDTGGMTYAGISRKWWPQWKGWTLIDKDDLESNILEQLVQSFYQTEYWTPICGEQIESQPVAESLYDFAVNAGLGTCIKLAQICVGVLPDGDMGPKTMHAINSHGHSLFDLQFTVAKVARYAAICNGDSSQKKFLLGWLNRLLEAGR